MWHGSARSVAWRDAARRPGSTPARHSTWPGSRRHAGTRRSRCTSLASSMPTPPPPDVAQAEAHYQQALALAEALGMRPLVAHCHRALGTLHAKLGQREQARAELDTAIKMYRAMDMTFWLPQAEAALAQVGGVGLSAGGA
jgi:tetratricopeptide (TPR) repeat protein